MLEVEPEALLDVRSVAEENRTEVLIKWKGMQDFEATWEDMVTLHHLFPSFHLEDKVAVWEGGIATHQQGAPTIITYVRRKGKGKRVNVVNADAAS